MALAPGTRFGSYEVVEPIGSGGMGEVYRARDTELKRDVAVKVLPPAFADDADRLARFRREAEILAALNHPNIAQVHGFDKVDDQMVIVMELVDGPTLADRIKDGPIPPDEALAIARQVADALEAAHAKQIVHRDLKPGNVKVREDGTVKVLDFGISKPVDPKAISGASPVMTTPAVTETGVIIGTAAYMSPEQARGKFVDQRTDIWAFGCLLFEMLTGQSAFGGEDVMLTLARVLDRDTDLSSIPKTISPAVRHTLKLCLEKDPKIRISDIRDVRLALEGRFESELPGRSEAVVAPPLWRRLLPIGATVVIVGVVAVFASGLLLEQEPPQVRRSVQVVPPELSWPNAAIPAIAISPDGSKIAYGVGGALYLRDLDELEGRPIPGTEGEIPVVPWFSPDGRWLLYGSFADQQLKRVSVEGGTPLPILTRFVGGGWTWTEQGEIHLSENVDGDCTLYEVSPLNGEKTVIGREPGFACFEPFLVPGSDYLVYGRRANPNSAESEIIVRSLATGEAVQLFPGRQPVYVDGFLVYFDRSLGLIARRFDANDASTGSPIPMIDDILLVNELGSAQFFASSSGTLVYVERGETQVADGIPLSIVDRQGGFRPLDVPRDGYRFPSVSPDGKQVAITVNDPIGTQVFVYDLAGDAEIRQLTFRGDNFRPAWSHDGWVIFSSDRDGETRLWRKLANGRGEAEPLTDPEDGHVHDLAAFTADGQRLAFSDTDPSEGPDEDIWIMDYPDGEPELLVDDVGSQYGIAFSPDGKAMAYASAQSNTWTLFVEPYPKEAGSAIRVSADGVNTVWPVWSHDSSRLVYQDRDTGRFGTIDIDTSSFSITNRDTLGFGGRPLERRAASMPDQDQLLVTIAAENSPGSGGIARRIVIVDNWIAEVRTRAPED